MLNALCQPPTPRLGSQAHKRSLPQRPGGRQLQDSSPPGIAGHVCRLLSSSGTMNGGRKSMCENREVGLTKLKRSKMKEIPLLKRRAE